MWWHSGKTSYQQTGVLKSVQSQDNQPATTSSDPDRFDTTRRIWLRMFVPLMFGMDLLHDQIRSIARASPIPTPMHKVANPFFPPVASN